MIDSQDIINAIKNLDIFLKVPELKGATVLSNDNGFLFHHTGGFNAVFQLTHKKKKWAFRVWFKPSGQNLDRSKAIAEYLHLKNLPYFVDFIYDKNR